jgi:hypothetical protein
MIRSARGKYKYMLLFMGHKKSTDGPRIEETVVASLVMHEGDGPFSADPSGRAVLKCRSAAV